MRNFSVLGGILILVLVFSGCASTQRGEPSPFEGTWDIETIEELDGSSVGFPAILVFRRNQFNLIAASVNPDESLSYVQLVHNEKFTYTATEIIITSRSGRTEVYNYSFQDADCVKTRLVFTQSEGENC